MYGLMPKRFCVWSFSTFAFTFIVDNCSIEMDFFLPSTDKTVIVLMHNTSNAVELNLNVFFVELYWSLVKLLREKNFNCPVVCLISMGTFCSCLFSVYLYELCAHHVRRIRDEKRCDVSFFLSFSNYITILGLSFLQIHMRIVYGILLLRDNKWCPRSKCYDMENCFNREAYKIPTATM